MSEQLILSEAHIQERANQDDETIFSVLASHACATSRRELVLLLADSVSFGIFASLVQISAHVFSFASCAVAAYAAWGIANASLTGRQRLLICALLTCVGSVAAIGAVVSLFLSLFTGTAASPYNVR